MASRRCQVPNSTRFCWTLLSSGVTFMLVASLSATTTRAQYVDIWSCNDLCLFGAKNGVCEDGGPGAPYASCMYGSDCSDCGIREPQTRKPTSRSTGKPTPRFEPKETNAPTGLKTLQPTVYEDENDQPARLTRQPTFRVTTVYPTNVPPTAFPTKAPPTSFPTKRATAFPTSAPPTSFPTKVRPTAFPTTPYPSAKPTSLRPTESPTQSPTYSPTTSSPSLSPSNPLPRKKSTSRPTSKRPGKRGRRTRR